MKTFKYLLVGSLFLASCGETDTVIQPETDNGATVAVTKELTISVLPMQTIGGDAATRSGETKPETGGAIGITYGDDTATRAGEAMSAAESKINNAYVLQFDGTSSNSTLVGVTKLSEAELTGNTSITCQFNMAQGRQNRVYVAANLSEDLVKKIDNRTTDLVSLAAFEAQNRYRASDALPTSGLPMSAMQDIGVGDSFDLFQLKSALAKLKFTSANPGAELTLNNIPNGYTFYQAEAGDQAYRPSGMAYDPRPVPLASGTTYYVPANIAGRDAQLVQATMRCSYFAPKNSMYVKMVVNSITYNVYLGDGSASDFNVVSGCSYSIKATIYGGDTSDMRVGNPSFTALDANGTANCYLPSAADTWYTFNGTVMGNGETTPAHVASAVAGDANFDAIVPSKLNLASAAVLWESLNTADAPAKGTVVSNSVHVYNGRIFFRTGKKMGNAVIAAKDASGTTIWSWHIWRTEGDLSAFTLNSITDGAIPAFTAPTLKMMDRNLGALRATPNVNITPEQDYGLFYQWGRKDPFQTQGGVTAAGGGSGITPADAVKHPDTFYTSGDWTSRNDNLWGCPLMEVVTISGNQFNKNAGSKTIYDPCPVGWRVAPGYTFANATRDNSPWDTVGSRHRNFAQITTTSSTPFAIIASGYRDGANGRLYDAANGYYWTSSVYVRTTVNGTRFHFNSGNVVPLSDGGRSYGFSLRCVQNP